jgi:hypothetical protein
MNLANAAVVTQRLAKTGFLKGIEYGNCQNRGNKTGRSAFKSSGDLLSIETAELCASKTGPADKAGKVGSGGTARRK